VLASRIPADILTTEVSLLYYAFRRKRPSSASSGSYTMHRRVGYLAVVIGLMMVVFVEIVPVHLLVSQWSVPVAWLFTGLSIYGCVWLVGDYRAMATRTLRVTPSLLAMRVGVRWEADIPIDRIKSVEPLSKHAESPGTDTLDAGLLGESNLRLILHESIEVIGMYGIRKSVCEIRLTVDDAEGFCRELRIAIAPERHGTDPKLRPASPNT
jgi:hypothetical protein